MILISHRGNTEGPSTLENDPTYVVNTLKKYNTEIDVWYTEDGFYLGHDTPTYAVPVSFLKKKGLWCHAKNLEALIELNKNQIEHFFWHDTDDRVLTSSGYFWTYPGKQLCQNSIAVMPEIGMGINNVQSNIYGVCSDLVGAMYD